MNPWDDLRYFLAVARSGSLSGAARELGVNHSTVLRRIHSYEERQGVRLFERLPTGYALTQAAENIYPHALDIEARVRACRDFLIQVLGDQRALLGGAHSTWLDDRHGDS
jgi:DNA-binding transcriptional LysR family regulator